MNEQFYRENPELENRQSKGHRFDVGTTVFTLFPEVFSEVAPNPNDYALIVGRENDVRIAKWIKSGYLKLPDNFESFKVFIPKANGSGKFGEALGEPIIGDKKHGHNTTFLSIGKFDTEEEAIACMKYIKTKFCRMLLGIRKVTQENSKQAWEFVPNQDFSKGSDIDWTKSIPEIDQQLYVKYGLEDYVDFIENSVKPMD
ncbi:MAG: restriction endonuclease [Alphaproteobacteria bacterium]|nr:restriction endonuclease [Alphaproteobacteria bacterium]